MNHPANSIDLILGKLARAVRRYVLLEGLALLLVLICGIFWITLGIDWVHFQLRRLELPVWFRVVCTLAGSGLLVAVFISLLTRLLSGLRSRALALVLERRFPQLNDRLITAVELASRPDTGPHSPLQAAMLERTSREAASLAGHLDLGSVFNHAPLRRLLTTAGVLVASVAVFGVLNAQAMERWIDAYLRARADYWSPFRQNQLQVRIIAQPGDRVREFDPQGVYKHPRGVSLELQVTSLDGHPVPQFVSLQTVSFTGTGTQRSRLDMQRVGDGEFRHRIDNVINDLQIWVTGGDFTNREPLRIRIVDPPRVDRLELACDYPDYIGWESLEDQRVLVASTQTSLPMETRFDVLGQVNKALSQVHLRTGRFDLSFSSQPTAEGLRLTIRDRETDVPRSIQLTPASSPLVNSSGTEFRLPVWITSQAEELLDQLQDGASFPIPFPSGEALQIDLEDTDGIYSPEPATFILNGIADQPPVVETRLRGVRRKVTRMATIPVEGRLTDDYGVISGKFTWVIDQSETPGELPLHTLPTGQKEFPLKAGPDDVLERFQLLPLTLKEGQALTLAIEAQDGDILNGPHKGRGQPFALTIVSNDELLSALYDDEINLRLRFEQIYSEVSSLKKDLDSHAGQQEAEAAPSAGTRNILAFSERGLHQLRKNHTESRAIEISFQDIREEMINNHIETRELLARIEQGVLEPIHLLNETEFAAADERFGELRLIAERGGQTANALQTSRQSLDAVLARMETILAEMRDRSSDQQLIQLLQQLIEAEEKLLKETQDKGLEEKFFQLGN